MRNLHFGIEIEMTGITRRKAAQLIGEFYHSDRVLHRGGTYDLYTAEDPAGRIWKAMNDVSILPQQKEDGEIISAGYAYRTEVVSPILGYDDINDLQDLVRMLRHHGALVNDSCGIHIHVGAESFNAKTLRNLANMMASKEDLLYKALNVSTTRMNHYCKKMTPQFIDDLNHKKPETMSELADLWYKEAPTGRSNHYNNSRYHGLNLHATFTKGTVEFRLFNGTLHAGEIKAYIQFCLALCHQALTKKKASPKKTETDNDKYAFRCWMLRLGLIGDEFKTCRFHFLKHLTGNSAWRNAA